MLAIARERRDCSLREDGAVLADEVPRRRGERWTAPRRSRRGLNRSRQDGKDDDGEQVLRITGAEL